MVPSKLRNVPPDDGILEVVGVGHVEHLEDRLERALPAEVERPGQPDVPREDGVVAADRVPLQHVAVGADPLRRLGRTLPGRQVVRAAGLRGWLRRVRAQPVVEVELPRQDRQHPGVEAVPLVAVAPVVLPARASRPGRSGT